MTVSEIAPGDQGRGGPAGWSLVLVAVGGTGWMEETGFPAGALACSLFQDALRPRVRGVGLHVGGGGNTNQVTSLAGSSGQLYASET